MEGPLFVFWKHFPRILIELNRYFPAPVLNAGSTLAKNWDLAKKTRNIIFKRTPGMDPVEAACTQNQTLTHRTFHNLRSRFGNSCISSTQLGKETTFPRPCHCNIKVIYFQTKELGNVNFKALRLTLTHLVETDGIYYFQWGGCKMWKLNTSGMSHQGELIC